MPPTMETVRYFAASSMGATNWLTTIAASISGERSDAEDIVQHAYSIALQKDNLFESKEQFIGWLAGIVRNCALNHRRKKYRRNTYATDPTDLTVATPEQKEQPIDRLTGELEPDQNSFDDQVQVALMSITPNARCCLLLRTVEGLSYKDISRLMDIPEGTAMNLVHRSKKKLRELLSTDSQNDSTSDRRRVQQ